MSDDVELLEAWRTGDDAAGNELLERYFQPLYRFFLNKVTDGVDDLVQRTLLSCVENFERLRSASSYRSYMFTIARNELYDHFKRRRRDREKIEFGVTSMHDLGPSPSGLVAGKREQKLLMRALRRIPADLQVAIELHYWEGLTSPELAEVLAIPKGTVKSRLRRGKELIRERMAELAESKDELETTMAKLDVWARSLRDLANPTE